MGKKLLWTLALGKRKRTGGRPRDPPQGAGVDPFRPGMNSKALLSLSGQTESRRQGVLSEASPFFVFAEKTMPRAGVVLSSRP